MKDRTYGRTRTATLAQETGEVWSKWQYGPEPGWNDDTNVVYGANIDRQTKLRTKVTKDTVTENFTERFRGGEIINNDFLSEDITLEEPIGYFKHVTSSGYPDYMRWDTWRAAVVSDLLTGTDQNGSYDVAGNVPPDLVGLQSLYDRAILEAHASVARAEAQALVTIAELHKSVKSLKHSFGVAKELFLKGSRIRKKLAKGLITTGEAASAWLEVRYGLRPIYYDVISSIEAVRRLTGPQRTMYRSTLDFSESEGNTMCTAASGHEFSRLFSHSGIVSCGILSESNLNFGEKFNQAFGLNELPQSGWELVPFSFVIDWFINVGDLIAAWTPKVDVTILASWVTIKEVRERNINIYRVHSGLWLDTDIAAIQSRLKYVGSHRYADPEKPTLPQIIPNLNWLKFLDLLALLRQIRPSTKKWRV